MLIFLSSLSSPKYFLLCWWYRRASDPIFKLGHIMIRHVQISGQKPAWTRKFPIPGLDIVSVAGPGDRDRASLSDPGRLGYRVKTRYRARVWHWQGPEVKFHMVHVCTCRTDSWWYVHAMMSPWRFIWVKLETRASVIVSWYTTWYLYKHASQLELGRSR
jgi:hypothetical protein